MKHQFHVACSICARFFVINSETILHIVRDKFVCDNCVYERKEREAIENE